jgi:hypothetical protein
MPEVSHKVVHLPEVVVRLLNCVVLVTADLLELLLCLLLGSKDFSSYQWLYHWPE